MPSPKPLHTCEFEIVPLEAPLGGSIEAAIYEEGGTAPTGIISTDQSWYVQVRWQVHGLLKRHLCGKWCICVYLERCGPDPDLKLPCKEVPINPCLPEGQYYEEIFRVEPGTIEVPDCGSLFCVCVVLTSKDACDPPGAGHVSGYCKGACVLIHKGPPHNGVPGNS